MLLRRVAIRPIAATGLRSLALIRLCSDGVFLRSMQPVKPDAAILIDEDSNPDRMGSV